MRMTKTLAVIASIIIVTLMASCTSRMGQRVISTTFAYPNSNVTPLGKVTAQKAKWGVLFAPTFKCKDYEEVANKALAQKGGNILINATVTYVTFEIPLYYFSIYKVTLVVEGTAAKMEVGRQGLTKAPDDSTGFVSMCPLPE